MRISSVNSIKLILINRRFPKWEPPLSTGKMKEKPGNMKGKGDSEKATDTIVGNWNSRLHKTHGRSDFQIATLTV